MEILKYKTIQLYNEKRAKDSLADIKRVHDILNTKGKDSRFTANLDGISVDEQNKSLYNKEPFYLTNSNNVKNIEKLEINFSIFFIYAILLAIFLMYSPNSVSFNPNSIIKLRNTSRLGKSSSLSIRTYCLRLIPSISDIFS